jgi:hypothetical protein
MWYEQRLKRYGEAQMFYKKNNQTKKASTPSMDCKYVRISYDHAVFFVVVIRVSSSA